MKNSVFALIFGLFLSLYQAHAQAPVALADGLFQDPQSSLSLKVPVEFKRVDPEIRQPLLIILLRPSNSQSFPTFNILRQPGSQPFESSELSQQATNVLHSYRMAGITDAVVQDQKTTKIAGRNALQYTLTYSTQRQPLKACTILLSGINQHYILTWIDLASEFESHSNLLDKLLSGLTLAQEALPTQQTTGSNKAMFEIFGALTLILLIALAALWRYKQKS